MQSSIPFFEIYCFTTIRIVFRFGVDNLLSKECCHKWFSFYDSFQYESKYEILNCFNSCKKTKEELKEDLNELIDFIGDGFDFSVLNQYSPLVRVFCSFPDLVGEISCDESISAICQRLQSYFTDYFNPTESELDERGKAILNRLKKDLKRFVLL